MTLVVCCNLLFFTSCFPTRPNLVSRKTPYSLRTFLTVIHVMRLGIVPLHTAVAPLGGTANHIDGQQRIDFRFFSFKNIFWRGKGMIVDRGAFPPMNFLEPPME